MPPTGKLPQDQIDVLTAWVGGGAPWSPDAPPSWRARTTRTKGRTGRSRDGSRACERSRRHLPHEGLATKGCLYHLCALRPREMLVNECLGRGCTSAL